LDLEGCFYVIISLQILHVFEIRLSNSTTIHFAYRCVKIREGYQFTYFFLDLSANRGVGIRSISALPFGWGFLMIGVYAFLIAGASFLN